MARLVVFELHLDVPRFSFERGHNFEITNVQKNQLENYTWLVAPTTRMMLDHEHEKWVYTHVH